MIVINGKTYRNLEEQVKKNMDDITELQNKSSDDVTKTYVDTQDQVLQVQITENTTDITELKSKTQTNTTNIAALETSKQNTLSQAQLNATNSGITATKVSKYDGYENTKQGKLTAGDNITISADNVISATGGGGGGISPSEANTFTGKQTFSGGIVSTKPATADDELTTLAQMKNSNLGNKDYTDTKFTELNNQLVATNTEVSNKLNKATSTSGSYAYVRNGTKDETIPVNSLVGKDAIVRRTSTGTIKANAGVDENDCVNKKQLDDAIAGVSETEVTKAYVDNGLAGKLDKMENTSTNTQCYVNQAGTNRLLNTSTNATRNLIVRWDNNAQLHANAGTTDDAVVNKKQLDDAIAGVSGGGAQLNVANTWTAVQTFNAGLTTAGAINISGQGSIDISGNISCDGGLTLAGGDILQGGTGNFADIITSNSYTIDTSASSTTETTIQALNLKYKYVSNVYTQPFYFVRKNSNVGAIILTNKDIDSKDFG